jgi:hypothetical protein
LELARLAEQLGLEKCVRSSIEKGTLRFIDAYRYYRTHANPAMGGLFEFLVDCGETAEGEAEIDGGL